MKKQTYKKRVERAFHEILSIFIFMPTKTGGSEEQRQYWYDWMLWTVYTYELQKECLSDLKTNYVFEQNKKKHIEEFEPMHTCNCFASSAGKERNKNKASVVNKSLKVVGANSPRRSVDSNAESLEGKLDNLLVGSRQTERLKPSVSSETVEAFNRRHDAMNEIKKRRLQNESKRQKRTKKT